MMVRIINTGWRRKEASEGIDEHGEGLWTLKVLKRAGKGESCL